MGGYELLGVLAGLSVVTFVGSILVLPLLVVRMPADYFTAGRRPLASLEGRHPALRLTALVLKNVLGALLVIAGLVMLVIPGQGILTILIGLSLLDIPGKRALEARIIGNHTVLRAINALRAQAHRPPLEMPDGHAR